VKKSKLRGVCKYGSLSDITWMVKEATRRRVLEHRHASPEPRCRCDGRHIYDLNHLLKCNKGTIILGVAVRDTAVIPVRFV
jgi:hypothetical protein